MFLYRVFRFIDRLRSMYMTGQPDNVWPHSDLQTKWVRRTADQILDWSFEARGRAGVTLYCALPHEIQKMVYKLPYDPYSRDFNRADLEHWLTNHVFFDQYGSMVIFHHFGKILWQEEDFDIDPKFEMVYGRQNILSTIRDLKAKEI